MTGKIDVSTENLYGHWAVQCMLHSTCCCHPMEEHGGPFLYIFRSQIAELLEEWYN